MTHNLEYDRGFQAGLRSKKTAGYLAGKSQGRSHVKNQIKNYLSDEDCQKAAWFSEMLAAAGYRLIKELKP